ncbi:MAG: PASTA domain-containing protein [Bacteroidota bacterium]
MKNKIRKYSILLTVVLLSFFVFLLIIDNFILPFYVAADEVKVPAVVGKHKDEAIKLLTDLNLSPVIQTSRYDERFNKDYVIFQKPSTNSTVKENRRVYLTVSGGVQTVQMPFLINKTVRDAQINLERIGLVLAQIEEVESEFPPNLIVEQQFPEGKEIPKGTSVWIKVSIGPKVGMVRVPNILGKSLNEVENILKSVSLRIGLKTYIHSSTLLPNTVVDQQPAENTLVAVGDSVNIVLTANK